jgi:hypothetical protein
LLELRPWYWLVTWPVIFWRILLNCFWGKDSNWNVLFCNVILTILTFTTISTYQTFPKTIEQIHQNMTGHMTSWSQFKLGRSEDWEPGYEVDKFHHNLSIKSPPSGLFFQAPLRGWGPYWRGHLKESKTTLGYNAT